MLSIKIERLKELFLKLAEIGKTSNDGVTRVAFSKEDIEARNVVIEKFKELNMNVKIDSAGNIIATSKTDSRLPAIGMGSHLDTVVNGGNFDGILGILSAIECYNTLLENDISLKRPVKIIVFAAEEGVRLNGTFGSRAMAGLVSKEEIETLKAIEKVSDVDFDNIHSCNEEMKNIGSFIELHIEQGKLLEKNKNNVGIVTDIFGIYRQTIEIFGEADHAGNTPMDIRNDAMVSAAKLITKLTDYVATLESAVATFGRVEVEPNCINVIPGYVNLQLELRSNDSENFEKVNKRLKSIIDEIGLNAKVKKTVEKKPKILNKDIQEVIKKSCIDRNVPYQYISSGAGHDSASFASILPTAMIFVPSVDGVSHSHKETTSWEDIEIGTNVLFETILNLDKAE